ncbi:PDR/VanB family oxidoreductase [Ideonella margarita]|uniref:PDR/VanB family oxidoreductase n=1 Tax=Ideonella margarita TaxID=2984191 RepID=A0ABU9CAI9_9BURK
MTAPANTASQAPLLTVQLARKWQEATDICGLELLPLPGEHLPPFQAGDHIDVHLPGGLVRPYSLCNSPTEADRYELGVLDAPQSRGGSRAVHLGLRAGQTLQISAPRHQFSLAPQAAHHLLMAGGIGITPLLSMAHALHAQGASFKLHLAVRSRSRAPYLERLAQLPWAASVALHFDDEPETRLDLAREVAEAPAGSHIYTCGPQGFMQAVLGAAEAAGWGADRRHQESFAAAAPEAGDQPFELELSRSGRIITVAADQTAARALTDAGVFLATSCEQGVCGTCLTVVLAGEPDHRDQYLTPEEQAANDQFLPCCSRAKGGRLVIDL